MKKKFRIIGVAVAVAVVAVIAFSGIALAADPTEVEVNWDGYDGWVWGDVDTGDSYTQFDTAGYYIAGQFTARDANDDPYGCGVDTCSSSMDAFVGGGGYIEYETTVTDWASTQPWWQSRPGEDSYNLVTVEDGWGTMTTRSTTHFNNGVVDNTYGWVGTGAHNFEVDAVLYEIVKQMTADDGDLAYAYAHGSGQAQMDCIYSQATGGAVTLAGRPGCGYYFGWGHDFNATGSGTFELYGQGNNSTTFYDISFTGSTGGSFNWTGSLDTSGLPTVTATDAGSGSSLQIIANFVSNFSMPNYCVNAQ